MKKNLHRLLPVIFMILIIKLLLLFGTTSCTQEIPETENTDNQENPAGKGSSNDGTNSDSTSGTTTGTDTGDLDVKISVDSIPEKEDIQVGI